MTEQLRTNYASGSSSNMANDDLSPRKTLLIFVVVIGCFAVLWPKLFYPMLVANANQHIKPSPIDKTTGCCDMISETDVNTIKIMSELCRTLIESEGGKPPTAKEIVTRCRKAVLETCGIDIAAVLQERVVSMGHSVKQILEEVRSLNGSLCLKYNFGVSPWKLGIPHRVALDASPSIRQERSSHLRSEMVHPAFRERGRAIPRPETVKRSNPPPRTVEGRPGPIPGLRPAMGGGAHGLPPKQQTAGIMGLVMPIYTIGIVVFFTYTILKLVFKKKPSEAYGPLYPPIETDENFNKEIFQSERSQLGPSRNHRDSGNSKLGRAELDQLRRRLRETEQAMQLIVEQMAKVPLKMQDEGVANGNAVQPQEEEEQSTVRVLGMETTASCEGGQKWSRPESPVLPTSPPPADPPQEIYLEGCLPPQSQLLVADSATEEQAKSEEDPAVVLAGKMTLSVISLDSSENGTDDSLNSDKKRDSLDEERRTISSHGSDEFEKVEAELIEDQINDIIEEAQQIAAVEQEDKGFSLLEEIEKMNREIREDLEKRSALDDSIDKNVMEEIKNQLQLEDDLLEALTTDESDDKKEDTLHDILTEFMEKESLSEAQNRIPAGERKVRFEVSKSIEEGNQEENIIGIKIEPKTEERDVIKQNINKQEQGIQEEITAKLSDVTPVNKNTETQEPSTETVDEVLEKLTVQPTEQMAPPKTETEEIITKEEAFSDKKDIQSPGDILLQSLEKITNVIEFDIASTNEQKKHVTESEETDDTAKETEVKFEPSILEEGPTNTEKDLLTSNEDQTSTNIETLVETRSNEGIEDSEDEEQSEDEAIEDIDYEDDSDIDVPVEEWQNLDRNEERLSTERTNGNDFDQSKYGSSSLTAAENEVSDEEETDEDADEEIEEIIEYVDNTDEEGEEIIEVVNNGNHENNLQNQHN